MSSRKSPTTVHLTKVAQEIKEKESPVWGLKQLLSAGLVLFNRLSEKEQKKAIIEAATPIAPSSQPKNLREALQNLKQSLIADDPEIAEKIRLLSKEEQAELRRIRKALGPEPSKKPQRRIGQVDRFKEKSSKKA